MTRITGALVALIAVLASPPSFGQDKAADDKKAAEAMKAAKAKKAADKKKASDDKKAAEDKAAAEKKAADDKAADDEAAAKKKAADDKAAADKATADKAAAEKKAADDKAAAEKKAAAAADAEAAKDPITQESTRLAGVEAQLTTQLHELEGDAGAQASTKDACTALRALRDSADDADEMKADGLSADDAKRVAANDKKRWDNEALRQRVDSLLRAKLGAPCPTSGVTASFRYGGGYVATNFTANEKRYQMAGWGPSAELGFMFGTASPRLLPGLIVHFQALPGAKVDSHSGDGAFVELAIEPSLKILMGRGWWIQSAAGVVASWTTLDAAKVHSALNPGIGTALTLGWDQVMGDNWALGAGVRVGYSHVFGLNDGPSAEGDVLATTLDVGVAGY